MRPHALSSAQADGETVIAIDFGGTKIDIALADATGGILHRVRLATEAERGPQQALDRVAAAVHEIRAHASRQGRPVRGFAAVSPGVVQEDRILLVPNLPGWETLALERRLQSVLGVDSVTVWNDVRAGALAELRHGNLRGTDPGLYISLGTGIAAAVTVGGTVLHGAHQAAGEIAYTGVEAGPFSAAATDHAPLENVVGGKALGARASELLGTPVDAAALFARTDEAARQIAHHALGVLAGAIANIAVLLDPARIVVGGGMMASADVLLPVLNAQIRRSVPFPPDLMEARFTEDASLHGAIVLALEAERSSHRSPAQAPAGVASQSPTAPPTSFPCEGVIP